jgi:arylformamidase
MRFMAPALVDAGIAFASVGYRLAPVHMFPTGFDDACSGIDLLIDRAASYDADASRIFVGGHSAGGHYAALMALTRHRSRLRGCLPISGVYDFGPASGLTMRPRFLGQPDSGSDLAASPIANIDAKPAAFLIAHGSEDFPHLIGQAERMEKALRAACGDVQRLVLYGRNHFTASYAGGEPNGPWVPRAVDWMSQHTQTLSCISGTRSSSGHRITGLRRSSFRSPTRSSERHIAIATTDASFSNRLTAPTAAADRGRSSDTFLILPRMPMARI